jgi:hypothetical protein
LQRVQENVFEHELVISTQPERATADTTRAKVCDQHA